MTLFNVKTIPLSNGHTYVGHSDRGFASTGVEKDVPVGPGIVYKGKNILFAEEFDDAGNASGAYIRIGESFTEVGLAKGNLRCGPVYRSGADGGAYGTLAIYDGAGQPSGASITFSHTNARLDVFKGGSLYSGCALFAEDGVHLGLTDGAHTTVLPDGKNIPLALPALPFHALHIEGFSYAKGFSRANGGEALNGFGADLRNKDDIRLGFFKDGKLDGIGIRKQPFRTVMGVFKNGTPVGGCLSIEKDSVYVSEYVTGFAKGVRVWMHPTKLFAGIQAHGDGCDASYTVDGGKNSSFRELACKIGKDPYQYLAFDPSKGGACVLEAGAPLELSDINHARLTPREEAMLADYEYRIDEVENDKDVAHREICLTRSHTTANAVTIPKIAKTLGTECFKGNESLASLTVGGNIKFIGDGCFRDCKRLTSVTLECGIDIIASGSFAGTSLREVVIPEGVLVIRTGAFADCEYLTDAYVPKDVRIADGAFPPHCKIHRGPKKVKPEKKKKRGPSLFERVGDGISAFFGGIRDFFKGLFKGGSSSSGSSYSSTSYSTPSRSHSSPSRPAHSCSYSTSSRTSSVPEIICTVVMILLVVLALSGVTNTVVQAIEKFVFSTYPSFYEFNLFELVKVWFEEDPDVFFLLVPLAWLVRIIGALLSVPVQLIIYLVLALGHVIVFVLGMGFNFIIIYAAAPAIAIFLLVRAIKNKDPAGVIYLIISILGTILYYIFSMATVR